MQLRRGGSEAGSLSPACSPRGPPFLSGLSEGLAGVQPGDEWKVKQGVEVQRRAKLQSSWQEVTAGGHPTREGCRPVRAARSGLGAPGKLQGWQGTWEPCWTRPSTGLCPRADTALSHLDRNDPPRLLKPRFKEQRASPRLMLAASCKQGSWCLEVGSDGGLR